MRWSVLAMVLQGGWAGDIMEELIKEKAIEKFGASLLAAGLTERLTSAQPYTLLAPTDQALSQLPPMLAHSIFSDTEALKKVLLYHVVPGAHALSSLTNDQSLTPEEGAALRPEEQPALRVNLYKKGQKDVVTVNGALVEKEIVASNGVILVISSFLHPRPTYTIADMLSLDSRFSYLNQALEVAGLKDIFMTGGPFTFFAPTNEAFSYLDGQSASKEWAVEMILNRVVDGTIFSPGLAGQTFTAETGGKITVGGEGENGALSVTVSGADQKAAIQETDLLVTNGVVHAIDRIL